MPSLYSGFFDLPWWGYVLAGLALGVDRAREIGNGLCRIGDIRGETFRSRRRRKPQPALRL